MLHPKLVACGLSQKHRLGTPKVSRMMGKKEKDLRKLQVGKGAQRRITEQEMAEREAMVNVDPGKRPKRVTPLKIEF
jgi:hypothetical protein